MHIIKRIDYIEKLNRVIGTPDIKVLVGVRRSGKSFLLNYLKDEIFSLTKYNVIYINFKDIFFEHINSYHNLISYVQEKSIMGKKNILLIDEIQKVNGFEIALDHFHNSYKYDVYVTGSNSKLLSSEISSLLTGRYFIIKIFPFSFIEYQKFYDRGEDIDSALVNYINDGGMAGSYNYLNESDKMSYINGIYNTIRNRDIIERYKISDIATFDKVSDFLLSNISQLISSNKIANTLASNKIKTSHVTVLNYITYLNNSLIFYKANRYDIVGKQHLQTLEKQYVVDMAFRRARLGKRNLDYGYIYENLVYIELLRRGYDVSIGKIGDLEVDFRCEKNGEIFYIQVCYDISNKDAMDREINSLLKIKDAYSKIIISKTGQEYYLVDGVVVYDLARWLNKTP